ncbi:MAG: hypothetical protein LBD43_01515 [Holosporales bacterium]|jgi:hypothetical protein|nr:hypothetical protein [Holosporales bacterium]
MKKVFLLATVIIAGQSLISVVQAEEPPVPTDVNTPPADNAAANNEDPDASGTPANDASSDKTESIGASKKRKKNKGTKGTKDNPESQAIVSELNAANSPPVAPEAARTDGD